MKRRLLDLICCPVCEGDLSLKVLRETTQSVSISPQSPACGGRCELHGVELGDALIQPDINECGACYSREIEEGVLVCKGCGTLYPIIGAVPRLIRNAEQNYSTFFEVQREAIGISLGHDSASYVVGHDPAVFDPRSNESFGLQWLNQAEGEKTWFKDDASLRKQEFLYSLCVNAEDLRGTLILDAGCGNGRLTASVATFGAEVVGMDLSKGIERAQAGKLDYAREHEHFVHFVQGNVMEPPFRAGSFDIVHSSGVLHHTPSTERALTSILSKLRPGGRLYVQLYRRREAWIGVPNAMLRAITCRIPPGFLYRICLAAVPAHTALVQFVARCRGEKSAIGSASVGERALSLFDNFSPRYQYRYRPEQVREMFDGAGLTEIHDTTLANEARHMVAFTGLKPR